MVAKLRTHNRFSFSVRMKRSATPLPRAPARSSGNFRCRRTRPPVENRRPSRSTRGRDAAAAHGPRLRRCPRSVRGCPGGSAQGLEAGPALGGMKTDALGVQWSTATKTKAGPSATVTVAVMSVPHITSGASVVMVPSCAFGRRVTRALRAWRSCSPSTAAPLLRGAPPLNPQLRPHFSVALAMKRRGFEHPTNVGHQELIRGGADRTAATTRRRDGVA